MLQILSCRMDVAAKYGLDAAIFLNNIVYWTLKNQAENRHFHEGRYWTYGTIAGLAKLYPLWSIPQIKRIISKCREAGILLVGDFNADRRIRTLWYSPSDEILALYDAGTGGESVEQNRTMQSTNSENAFSESGKSIIRKQVATKQVEKTPKAPKRGLKSPGFVWDCVVSFVGDDPGYQAAFAGLLENREALGKPVLTTRSINTIINKLRKVSREEGMAMLDKAVERNWLTVYPLKDDERPASLQPDDGRRGRCL